MRCGVAVLALASACAPPDVLGGATWACALDAPVGDRLVDGARVPCADLGSAWAITLPVVDGDGTFTEQRVVELGQVLTAEWPLVAVRVEAGAWTLSVPTYRCADCSDDGSADGLSLSCIARSDADDPEAPVFAHCAGVDGSGAGWDLRLPSPAP